MPNSSSSLNDVLQFIHNIAYDTYEKRNHLKTDVIFCSKVIGTFDKDENKMYGVNLWEKSNENIWTTVKKVLTKPEYIILPELLSKRQIRVFWLEGNVESIGSLRRKLSSNDAINAHAVLVNGTFYVFESCVSSAPGCFKKLRPRLTRQFITGKKNPPSTTPKKVFWASYHDILSKDVQDKCEMLNIAFDYLACRTILEVFLEHCLDNDFDLDQITDWHVLYK
ncbi:hypothetical protein HK096_011575 [Nowakowskiella sp. JEL0078]|nr:hypothetical protein HK096_011575 [Nowakowskiella sp. JEL0078]